MRQAAQGIALAAALLFPAQAAATAACTANAMVVFDGSSSMAKAGPTTDGVPRIVLAREAMREAMHEIAVYRHLGLVVYGPGSRATACDSVDLRFPPTPDAAERIIAAVEALTPAGNTPLTDAVQAAALVLNYAERPATVVLVTDGRETCGGSPCALGAELAARGADMTVHVIGFQLQPDHTGHPLFRPSNKIYKADCLAEETGGKAVTTETVGELVEALRETLGCPVVSLLEPIRLQNQ